MRYVPSNNNEMKELHQLFLSTALIYSSILWPLRTQPPVCSDVRGTGLGQEHRQVTLFAFQRQS